MIRPVVFILGVLAIIFSIISCATHEKFFVDSGIFGEHQLSKIRQQEAVNGRMAGAFFFGCGSVSGSIQVNTSLQFSWQPKSGDVIITTLPFDKLRFVVDSLYDVPSVEFIMNTRWLKGHNGGLADVRYNKSDLYNLNQVIQSDYLSVALIRISAKTMEQEIYLPQI